MTSGQDLDPFQLESSSRYTASAPNSLPGSTEVRRECLLGSRLTPSSRMKMENTQITYTQLAAKSKFLRCLSKFHIYALVYCIGVLDSLLCEAPGKPKNTLE